MNHAAAPIAPAAPAALIKLDASSPALLVTGRTTIAVKAGTIFNGRNFIEQTPVVLENLVPGADYGIIVDGDGGLGFAQLGPPPFIKPETILGGFHFAPGGNAPARAGGDEVPAINPFSVWDKMFRPACLDPRGMAFVATREFWADIYLLASDHLAGTSRFGVTIADGNDPPQNPAGGRFEKLDYDTAVAVMKHHGKSLLGAEESFAAYIGGTEKTALGRDPRITGLDAARTSKWGVMQPFGAMWQWGHDGDPDVPRASIFGGSWRGDGDAGSRYAYVAYYWPDDSNDYIGARGRGDHLQPV